MIGAHRPERAKPCLEKNLMDGTFSVVIPAGFRIERWIDDDNRRALRLTEDESKSLRQWVRQDSIEKGNSQA